MEGTDEVRTDGAAVDEAIARDAQGLVRFATASLGARDEAIAIVQQALVEADAAVQKGDLGAVLRPRLFGLVRRKAAQLVEQRRRSPEGAKLAPHPFLEHVRPTEREALLLRYVGRLSPSDVAGAAAIDEAGARQRLSRGLAFLCRLGAAPSDAEPPSPEIAKRRQSVEEGLSDIVDGLGSDEVADFVAEDDPSRDLVHDAEKVVERLRGLESDEGLDAAELSRRFVAACNEARGPLAPALDAPPVAAPPANTEPVAVPPADTAKIAASPVANGATGGAEAAKPSEAESERLARRKRAIIALGVAAAVGAFALVVGRSGDGTHYADTAWSGTVGSVSRAFGGGVGLERCSPDRAVCSRVDRGDDVPAGSTLRTDGQSRAVIELRDGTRIVLDRDSELLLDGAYARRARLDHGSLVADVAQLGESRARFDLPLGFVETEATKVSLMARTSRADAEVARGSVHLVDSRERGVAVHAGEVGTLEPGEAPVVYPSASLGERFGWTERAFSEHAAPEETIRGLGELGAKRPGDDHERKGLVALASHTTRVRIVGNVARTEIEEEFTSSSDDVLEGVFRFPLPPDAQIERLALDVDGKLEEGAFVDRDRASAIWRGAIVNAGGKKPVEEIVWVPGPWRDPALLEWQRGGRFELRIYPIPKRASRKVLLAYTQVIPPSGGLRRYVYPLPYDPSGSTRVGRFDLDVEVRGNDGHAGVAARGYTMRQQALPDGASQLSLVAQGFSPSGDLVVEYSLPDSGRELTAWAYQPSPDESARGAATTGSAEGAAAYVALALRPKLPRTEDAVQRDFALVVDSSRSMFGERYRRAAALAESVVREMDRGDRVTVLACDSTCRELPSGLVTAGPEAARGVREFLHGVTPEGGSDVAAAVRRGSEALRGAPKGGARIVYIGDGTPTIGPVGPAFVRREIEAGIPRDFGTVTAVAIGSDADVSTLRVLADAGGGVLVPYTPGQTLLDTAFALLGATYGTTLTDAAVELPDGLFDVAPRTVGTLRAGGETIVVARMNGSAVAGTVTLRGKVAGTPFEQRYPVHIEATTAKGNAFVPRLWAAARIGELELTPDVENRRLAVELSARFHVASRFTSLLVLESAAMMQAFGLQRDERAALWTGDTTAESTAAEGETAIADAEDGRDMMASGADKAQPYASGGGLGASPAHRAAPRSPLPFAPSESPAAAAAPEPAPKAAAPRDELYAREGGEGASGLEEERMDRREKKKESYAPPPPVATAAPSKPAGRPGKIALQESPRDEDMAGPALMPSPFNPPPPRFGRRYIPMRKIWERVGRIVAPATTPSSVTPEAIAAAERDASGGDPRRDSLKRLYTLYLLDGRLDSAAAVAERWSTKDPLDPDALTARADIAAARGERELAIRILGSVVDVRPGDHKAVFRLARLHRWAGRPELSCRHSMAAAEIRSTDASLLAEAVRCTRDLGDAALASDLTAAADEPTRRAADKLLAGKPVDPSQLAGDLRLEATWDGGDDLDLALLPPDGARVSWLGAPTRAVITARDVESTSREGLGLRGSSPGDYVVEITRPLGHRGTVRGSVAVYAAGERRTLPFAFDGPSTRIAVLKITTRSRLVPL